MSSVFITQPNYVPWIGWFLAVSQADHLVLLDTVQMTRQDWRTRNLLPTALGSQWLSIPVQTGGRLSTAICETKISASHSDFHHHHWETILQALGNLEYFPEVCEHLEDFYLTGTRFEFLVDFTIPLTCRLLKVLGVHVNTSTASDLFKNRLERIWVDIDPTRRILEICHEIGATQYISSLSAMGYLDTETLALEGITTEWIDPVHLWKSRATKTTKFQFSVLHDLALSGRESLKSSLM